MTDECMLLNTEQAAKRFGLSPRTLERYRVTGEGPEYVKLGHAVRYSVSALRRWLKARTRRSTSDDGRGSKKNGNKKRDD